MSSKSSDNAMASESSGGLEDRTLSNNCDILMNDNQTPTTTTTPGPTGIISDKSLLTNSKPKKTVKTMNSQDETNRETMPLPESQSVLVSGAQTPPAQVLFDNAKQVVNAGQIVTGKVLLDLQDDIDLSQLHVKIVGTTKTSWLTKHNKGRGTRMHGGERVHYEAEPHLTFVTKTMTEESLPAGKHVITFNSLIDERAPSSYEDDFASISYYCKAVVHYPEPSNGSNNGHSNGGGNGKNFSRNEPQQRRVPMLRAKTKFYVIAHERLDDSVGLLHSVTLKETQTVKCCGCVAGGEVTVQMSLEKRGFVCGDVLPISVAIQNDSRRKLTKIRLSLEQHIIYREDQAVTGTNEVQEHHTSLQTVHAENSIQVGSSAMLDSSGELRLCIMPTPPTYSTSHNYLSIAYNVLLNVQDLLTLSIPIKIGTAPFTEEIEHLQPTKDNQLSNVQLMLKPSHALKVLDDTTYIGPLYPFYLPRNMVNSNGQNNAGN